MDIAELKNADGEIEVALGDRIKAMVVSTQGGLTLSRRLGGSSRAISSSKLPFKAACRGREVRTADQGWL